jgi:hypothetical protein
MKDFDTCPSRLATSWSVPLQCGLVSKGRRLRLDARSLAQRYI